METTQSTLQSAATACRAHRKTGSRGRVLNLTFCVSLAFLAGCPREKAVVTEKTDTREAIQVAYVGAPELKVHAKTDDASRVMTTFLNGESVSILARKGDWVEVRITSGSGWAHANELTSAAEAKAEEATPNPKFRVPPSPISAPGTKGTIYIEGLVNTDGDIVSTKVIVNTTGSEILAARNAEALQHAKFYPIVRRGQKKEFIYDYRVDY